MQGTQVRSLIRRACVPQDSVQPKKKKKEREREERWTYGKGLPFHGGKIKDHKG